MNRPLEDSRVHSVVHSLVHCHVTTVTLLLQPRTEENDRQSRLWNYFGFVSMLYSSRHSFIFVQL